MFSGPIMRKLRGASAACAFKMLTGKQGELMSNPAAQWSMEGWQLPTEDFLKELRIPRGIREWEELIQKNECRWGCSS